MNASRMAHIHLIFAVIMTASMSAAAHAVSYNCPPNAVPGFPAESTAPCYLFERFGTQFVTAERMCRFAGGHLASISDKFANTFVTQMATEVFSILPVHNFWVGGHDLERLNEWEWIDHETWHYTNWDKNEPTLRENSSCVSVQLYEGLWRTQDCYERKPYACALPALVPTHNGTLTTWTPSGRPTTFSTRMFQSTTPELSTSTPLPTQTMRSSFTTAAVASTEAQTTTTLPTEPSTSTTTRAFLTTTNAVSTTDEPSTTTRLQSTKTDVVTSTTEDATTTIVTATTSITAGTTEAPTTSTLTQTSTAAPTTITESSTTTQSAKTTTPAPLSPCPSNFYSNERIWLNKTISKIVENEPKLLEWHYDDETNMCYLAIISYGWKIDKDHCEREGGSLVSIHSRSDNGYLKAVIHGAPKNPNGVDVSIGLREVWKRGARQWSWVDNSPVDFTNWGANEPQDAKHNEPMRCVSFLTNTRNLKKIGQWRTAQCDQALAQAVCSVEANWNKFNDEAAAVDLNHLLN